MSIHVGMAMKPVLVGIRPNSFRFGREISELIEYGFGFGDYPTFLIEVGVRDKDVTTHPIPFPYSSQL